MNHRTRRVARAQALIVITVAAALLAACGPPPVESDPRAVDGAGADAPAPVPLESVEAAIDAWIEGRSDEAAPLLTAPLDEAAPAPPARVLLARGEFAHQRGLMDGALAAHAALLAAHPDDPLAATAALRLWQLRDHAARAPRVARQALADLDWSRLSPTARLWTTRLASWLAATSIERAGLPIGPAPAPAPALSGLGAADAFDAALPAADLIAYGQPTQWRWVGPFNNNELAAAQEVFAPERAQGSPLEATYALERGATLTRRAATFGGAVQPPWTLSGVYYLESVFVVDAAAPEARLTEAPTELLVTLHTTSSATVWIDGEQVVTRALVDGYPSFDRTARVSLTPGVHRVLVKLSVASQSTGFELALAPAVGGLPLALRHVDPSALEAAGDMATQGEVEGVEGLDLLDAAALESDDPLALWAATAQAEALGDHAWGLTLLDRLDERAPLFVPAQLVAAELLRGDPALAPERGLEAALDRLRGALELDPEAAHAHMMLGFLLHNEGQHEAALEHLDAAAAQAPDAHLAHYYRHLVLEAMGWEAPAREALERAFALHPEHCGLASRMLTAHDQLEAATRFLDPLHLPPEAARCDAIARAIARHRLVARGDVEEAVALLEAQARARPMDAAPLLDLAALHAERRAFDEALAALDRAAERGVNVTRQRVDLLLARGDEAGAREVVEAALAARPTDLSLLALRRYFEGSAALEALRVDGLALVQDYLRDPIHDNQAGFYLLDYAAFRYYPDGSSISVTHQISQVLNKDGIEALGEVRLPPDVLVTRLRTIKRDGVTTIEPEQIPNKTSISMPNLEAGDFIEVEYILAQPPVEDGDGAFVAPRWYFQTLDAPLMHSEVIFELPADFTPLIEVRGAVPEPTITTVQGGDFARYRYLMTEMLPPREEPLGPPALEVVPSIQVAAGLTLDAIHDVYRDRALATTRPSHHLAQALDLALSTLEPGASARAKAEALFRFVKREVTDEGSGPFDASASWTWTRRAGSRLILLKTLLDMAGIEADFALVSPFGGDDAFTSPVPSLAAYNAAMLVIDTGAATPVWVDPSVNHALFDYAPPFLQGRPAVTLGDPPRELRVARYDPALERRQVAFDLSLDAEGHLSGQGSEHSDGINGTNLRRFLDRLQDDPEQLTQVIERALAPYFRTVTVTDHSTGGMDGAAPVHVTYDFTAPDFARVQDGELRLQAVVYNENLSRRFAALPTREQPLVIPSPTHNDLQITLTLPPSASLQAPSPQEITSPFGAFRREVSTSGDTITISDRFDLPMQRIAPADYAAFRQFAAAVDAAQVIQLRADLAE